METLFQISSVLSAAALVYGTIKIVKKYKEVRALQHAHEHVRPSKH